MGEGSKGRQVMSDGRIKEGSLVIWRGFEREGGKNSWRKKLVGKFWLHTSWLVVGILGLGAKKYDFLELGS
jgi:hypothetical protein